MIRKNSIEAIRQCLFGREFNFVKPLKCGECIEETGMRLYSIFSLFLFAEIMNLPHSLAVFYPFGTRLQERSQKIEFRAECLLKAFKKICFFFVKVVALCFSC